MKVLELFEATSSANTVGSTVWWTKHRTGVRRTTPDELTIAKGRIIGGIEDIVKTNVDGITAIVSAYEIMVQVPKEWQQDQVERWLIAHDAELVMW